MRVTEDEIRKAYDAVPTHIIEDLKFAAERIEEFALLQKKSIAPLEKEVSAGIILGHRIIPVSSCGAYVPGGRYPLPSSALMSIIPARVAGVKRIVACLPPSKATGTIHPATLVAMNIAGASEIYCMGGAQAIAAHILPTMKASRYTGGVWVGTFLKITSFQKITKEGAEFLAPAACRLAKLEGLSAHNLAAEVRK